MTYHYRKKKNININRTIMTHRDKILSLLCSEVLTSGNDAMHPAYVIGTISVCLFLSISFTFMFLSVLSGIIIGYIHVWWNVQNVTSIFFDID